MTTMTLDEWKAYFLASWTGNHQRGPSDSAGWRRDAEVRAAVEEAASWDDLCAAVPGNWRDAAANRCRREHV